MKIGAVISNGQITSSDVVFDFLYGITSIASVAEYASANLDTGMFFICVRAKGDDYAYVVQKYQELDGELFAMYPVGTFKRLCCAEMVCDMNALDGLTANN